MHVLFVHKNYPAQFGHIAARLVQRYGFQCTFISERPAGTDGGVRRIQYRVRGGATRQTHYCSRSFENFTWHSHAVYEALKAHPEVRPDPVVGHSGFGSTLFLADLYGCPIVDFFEWYYQADHSDFGFRAEFPTTELHALRARGRNAMLLADLETCTLGYSPTHWQRSCFPSTYQHKLSTIFDGIDTRFWRRRRPEQRGPRRIAGREVAAGMKIVTYVSRGFESMRGFDIFMRAAQRICQRRRDVLFVCVGSDRVCYGGDEEHTRGRSFRRHVLARDHCDLDRFLFTGQVPPAALAEILNLSDLHVYLTVPFVLSWSLMDALACGCTVLASDTEPVREVIDHGRNGLLCPFYDVDGFAAQAMEVLDDPPAYRPLGDAGIETIAARYSLDVVLPRMLELYEAAARRHAGGSAWAALESTATVEASSAESGLSALARRHPWPQGRPTGRPIRCCRAPRPEHERIPAAFHRDARCIVELGAWTGQGTRRIAQLAPHATVVAVEAWERQNETAAHPDWRQMVPVVYERFLANCWEWRGRIVPLALLPADGLREVFCAGIEPDAIWVNAHYVDRLDAALQAARQLFPHTPLAGDNWQWPRLRQTVAELLEQDFSEIEVAGDLWRTWKEAAHDGRAGEAPAAPLARATGA